jgi:hypothetical protein
MTYLLNHDCFTYVSLMLIYIYIYIYIYDELKFMKLILFTILHTAKAYNGDVTLITPGSIVRDLQHCITSVLHACATGGEHGGFGRLASPRPRPRHAN